ncbi:3-dehydroquinate synthase [Ramlibacter sp.]|uniref:3-dehydroquinate synthase n=1 Tax=Ramlibacter sp. TaxID=1917967 RepID=UPI003D0C6831
MLPASQTPERIEVRTSSRPSTILVGTGALDALAAHLDEAGVGRRRFIVSNPKVWRLHGARIQQALGDAPVVLVPDGERYKTVRTTEKIYDALIAGGADRGSAVVAVGGGVVGDMAGFAAASFLRGITLAHVPTTLLAQVDSSIGGKVGVNHALGKNLIGAFHQPAVVVIDPGVLSTLPRREFRSGLYEVVKYGMIASRPLFETLTKKTRAVFKHDPDVLLPIVAASARIKADVVSADERESGLRRILNFGHTVGHALEAETHYRRFRHGEAIAWGMLLAADLGVARGTLPEADRAALAALVGRLGPLPPVADLPIAGILAAVKRDKKVVNSRLHFVLCTSIGTTDVVDDVTEDELTAALVRLGLSGI